MISPSAQAFALDDKGFDCIAVNYWLALSTDSDDEYVYKNIERHCPFLSEGNDIGQFMDIVEAGDPWFFKQHYGEARFERFRELSVDAFKVIQAVDGHLLKTMP